MAEWMKGYLDQVCAQIDWKLARPVVLRELENHLQDQYEACRADGMTALEAQEEALRQMGDPVAVGKGLDKVHRPKYAWEIMAVMAVLLATGLALGVLVFSKQSNWSMDHWFWTPLLAAAIGTALCAGLSRLDMNLVVKKAWHLYGAGLLLMTGCVCYSVRILEMGGINYLGQYGALLLPVAYCGAVYRLRGRGAKGLLLCAAALAPMVLLCSLTGTLWPQLCLCCTAAVTLLAANGHGAFGPKKGRTAAVILTVTFLAVLGFLALVWDRLAALLRPLNDGLAENFRRVYIQGLLSHSQAFGQGTPFLLTEWGTEITPERFLADAVLSTDFLLTGVSYRCGWAVALGLLAAVIVLLVLLLRRGLKQRTLWGKLMACAVTVPLVLQTVGYVLANLGLPLSSFRLPLLSYGGKFRILDLALLGLLLSVFRCRTILRDEPQTESIDKKILTST